MRKLLTIGALLLCISVNAERISVTDAAKTASEFLSAEVVSLGSDDVRRAPGANSAYYIFTTEANDAFVILAGDTRMPRVLGYSHDTGLDLGKMPPQLPEVLQAYASVYDYVQRTGADVSAKSPSRAVPVQYTTALWDQGEPFNRMCPLASYTGCVATAMAIKMKYHNYPARGRGFHSYECDGQTLSMNFDFDLNFSLMDTDYAEGTYTSAQASAVAKLMYACGVAVDMRYGVESSSAYLRDVIYLAKYFGYSNDIETVSRTRFTDEEWIRLLDNELDNVGPVIYRGEGVDGGTGHAFLIDGRDSGGMYHLNWGWGGYCNGYFRLDALTPSDYDFSYDSEMIINARPNNTGDFTPLMFRNLVGGHGVAYNRNRIVADDYFFATASSLYNRDNEPHSGTIALAITDKLGNIKEIISEGSFSLNPYYYYKNYSFWGYAANRDAGPDDMLTYLFKDDNDSDWRQIVSGYGTKASVSAWNFNPEYATVSWKLNSGITIKSTYYQHQDKALKYSFFNFLFNYDANLIKLEVTVNGEVVQPSTNGWYSIPFVDADKYEIRAYDANDSGIDDVTDFAGNVDVYTLQGLRIASGISRQDAIESLKSYPKGVYLLRYGVTTEKVSN